MINALMQLIASILQIPPDWDEDWEARRDRDINDED